MKYHLIAFISGFLLDLILGDPVSWPHPIRVIGSLVGRLDEKLNTKDEKKALKNGKLLGLAVALVTGIVTTLILVSGYMINVYV